MLQYDEIRNRMESSSMSTPSEPPKRMTEAEYLIFERASEFRHEFVNGEVLAMTGPSRAHNLISVNVMC
jgi:Uma2 family endonuclease